MIATLANDPGEGNRRWPSGDERWRSGAQSVLPPGRTGELHERGREVVRGGALDVQG